MTIGKNSRAKILLDIFASACYPAKLWLQNLHPKATIEDAYNQNYSGAWLLWVAMSLDLTDKDIAPIWFAMELSQNAWDDLRSPRARFYELMTIHDDYLGDDERPTFLAIAKKYITLDKLISAYKRQKRKPKLTDDSAMQDIPF